MKQLTNTWVEQYRNASSQTPEGKFWLAACYVRDTEAAQRAVAQIAFDQHCAIWHAAWVYYGQEGACACSPCRKAAAAAAVRYEVFSAQPGQPDTYRARYDNLTEAQAHCRAIEARMQAEGFTYIVEVKP